MLINYYKLFNKKVKKSCEAHHNNTLFFKHLITENNFCPKNKISIFVQEVVIGLDEFWNIPIHEIGIPHLN